MNLVTEKNIQLNSITFCKYELRLPHKSVLLSFPQLLELRKGVNYYCSHENLEELIDNENFVLLFVADRQHLIYLDITSLLDLKEAIDLIFYTPSVIAVY